MGLNIFHWTIIAILNSTLADYETPNFREGLAPLISGINFVS